MFSRSFIGAGISGGGSGLSDWIDVTASPYNAPADGGVDDDPIFRQAITDASISGAPKTVYFPAGEYQVLSNLIIEHCNVICSPGARFLNGGAIDMTLFTIGLCGRWHGGVYDFTAADFDGVVFLLDGNRWTNSPWASINTTAPYLADITAFSYRKVAGSGTLVKMQATGAGERLVDSVVKDIRGVYFNKCVHLYCSGTSWITLNKLYNITAPICSYGIHFDANGTFRCDSNKVFGFTTQNSGAAPDPTHVAAIQIDGCYDNIIEGLDLMDGCLMVLDAASGRNLILGTTMAAGAVTDLGTGNIISLQSNKTWGGMDLGRTESFVWRPGATPGTVNDNDYALSGAITLGNAALGDFVLLGQPYDMQDCFAQAFVTASNTATIILWNGTGGNITDFASGTWKLRRVSRRLCTAYTTWNPAVAANGFSAAEMTIAGADYGDFVLCSVSTDSTGLIFTASVTALDTITVVAQNVTGDVITLANNVLRIKLIKGNLANQIITWDPAELADGTGESSASGYVFDTSFGDPILVAPEIDTIDCMVTANQAAAGAGTIQIRLQNETGAVANLGSAKWRIKVFTAADVIV